MTLPDPRANRFSAADDHLVFYIYGVCPFLDVKRHLKLLPNKSASEIYERFTKIMHEPKLQARLLEKYDDNLIYNGNLPFSPSENYSLQKIYETNKRHWERIISTCPYLFNPSRSPKSIMTYVRTNVKKESKRNTLEKEYYIKKYLSFITTVCKFKSICDIKPEIHPIQDLSMPELFKSPIPKDLRSLQNCMAFINSQFHHSDLAGLFGFLEFHKIKKTRVVIGRPSPRLKTDIDLALYNMQTVCRQHCAITFCSDGRFYLTVLGRDVFINSEIFYRDQNIQLKNYDMIDIGGVPLIFLENPRFRMQIDQIFNNGYSDKV